MTKKNTDRSAKSMLFSMEQELGLNGLFEGKIVHLSFDCPTNLRDSFNTESKDDGTSSCKLLQEFMAYYVTASRIKKHALGNTLSKILKPKLTIENLNFEQYCQTRPRRWIRKPTNEVKAVNIRGETGEFCGIGKCSNMAVASGVYFPTGEKRLLCEFHANEFSNRCAWKVEWFR